MVTLRQLLLGLLALWVATAVSAQGKSPERVVVEVEWPKDFPRAAAPLPDPKLQSVFQTLLPVLLPSGFLKHDSFAFVGEPLHYTASIRSDRAQIAISGTRVEYVNDELQSEPKPTEISVRFSEVGVEATMLRYGVAYSLAAECERQGDARCKSGDYVRNALASATIVGGGRASAAQVPQIGAAAPLPPTGPPDPAFAHLAPGDLVKGSGEGVISDMIYAPNMRFPVQYRPAYLNSQVWGIGGMHGPAGSWKDSKNYQYPWRDNFCESRSRKTPLCPSGTGHQGVDIRPADARDVMHWAVAAEDGRIVNVGLYSVWLTGSSGIQYRYLHLEMHRLAVKSGDRVQRGERIGLISDDFTAVTPVHLHFEIVQNIQKQGLIQVPPYTSLVNAYATADAPPPQASDEKIRALRKVNPESYVDTSAIWKGDRLPVPVCWEASAKPFATERRWVEQATLEVMESVSHIRFARAKSGQDAWPTCRKDSLGIRVAVADAHPVSDVGQQWLRVGENWTEVPTRMTLNLALTKGALAEFCSDRKQMCIKVVGVHEFMHGIGFLHEHLRSGAPKDCYDRLRHMSDVKGYKPLPKSDEYDAESIMNYCENIYREPIRLSTEDVEAIDYFYRLQ
jgi:murein DD-endopeptidase MepM/ murein hydrolase activator NlpD